MATAKVKRTGDRQRSRWKRNLVLLVLLAAGIALAFSWDGLRDQARVGAAYAARVGCTCRYVSGRPLESCGGDIAAARLGRTANLMFLSEDAENRTVKASVPLLSAQRAAYDAARGCRLEPWAD